MWVTSPQNTKHLWSLIWESLRNTPRKNAPKKLCPSKSDGDLLNLHDNYVMSDGLFLTNSEDDGAFGFDNWWSTPVELGKCTEIVLPQEMYCMKPKSVINCLRLRNQTPFSTLSLHPLPLGMHLTKQILFIIVTWLKKSMLTQQKFLSEQECNSSDYHGSRYHWHNRIQMITLSLI